MAKMSQLYTVAGTTKFKGKFKVRFANDLARRVKILSNEGHENIELVELPKPMTKAPAVAHLMGLSQFGGDARKAVEKANQKYNGSTTVKVKAKAKDVKVKASTPVAPVKTDEKETA